MKSDTASNNVVLYWHRTDLRLHDSPALHAALALKPSVFIPIWTWDPHYVYRARVGPNRWKFLLDCQVDLNKSYTKLNPNQKLWVVREAPQTVLPKLWKEWKVTHLVFEKDTDAYARDRDKKIMSMAKDAGVHVIVKMGRNLFDPDELVQKNNGKPTMSMAQVEHAANEINQKEPEKPLPPLDSLPNPWDQNEMKTSNLEQDIVDAKPDFNEAHRTGRDRQYKHIMGPENSFGVLTFEEIGIDPSLVTTSHNGGETVALNLLDRYIQDEEYIGRFEKPKTSPADFEPQSTTLLSPHLHFGSLSVRKFWWDVQLVLEKRRQNKKSSSSIPTNLPGQLLFRDMFFGAQAAIGYEFAQTHKNNLVRFIDWHLPSNLSAAGFLDGTYTVDSPEAEKWFQRWKQGQTGFPWIDALMRQLKLEGWIHHLGRHSVACFLTRGGCYVNWERGAEVFEEWLIDHETACNVGNWMWLSCTAFFHQFYRCYSPIAFGKKWDPNGNLIRRYCPELAKFDKKYIYEPWKASVSDQKNWGCRITGDVSDMSIDEGRSIYPEPMFNFDERRQICIGNMKRAYDVGIYGDDEQVRDGSWQKVFGHSGREAGPEPKRKRQKVEGNDRKK